MRPPGGTSERRTRSTTIDAVATKVVSRRLTDSSMRPGWRARTWAEDRRHGIPKGIR